MTSTKKFWNKLKISRSIQNNNLKGRIAGASRASVYTNAIFASQNACWEFPNPLWSASYRCRLRVRSERFFDGVMIQWYIRRAQPHLKEKVPTMILSAPTVTYLLLFDVRYVIDICVQNIGCGFLLPRCKTAQLPVQLIICHIRCWRCGVPD